ncbi:MAG: malto-oligosyltrehalose trehalohydrolase [Burkholderiales bacterium]
MKRHHHMPFGAEFDGNGAVRFKLWAPQVSEVRLDIIYPQGKSSTPMASTAEGWFALRLEGIEHGTRYSFSIDQRISVPDPASRFNPQDVHSASAVIDPHAFEWPDASWRGRPWEEAVIYELHVGTFTPAGTFNAAIERLDYLVRLGVTAVELMPVADFPGKRNWGYDGVLPFAPDSSYGSPEDLKSLVAGAHARGLMMFLDVVYNHFGPEGNYLHTYAPQFFNPAHVTPWGAAINYDGERARVVRDFFIHNALYWLEEFHFDGLRLDAVHAIADDSRPDIIDELAAAVRAGPGQQREVHIVLENDRNEAARLVRSHGQPRYASAQWNDDVHHAFHVLATGERDGYYGDYAHKPLWWLGRALAQGFGYQGEISQYRGGRTRGEISSGLPPSAFVNFIQNHDQIGNRALGERLSALVPAPVQRLETICLLLAPSVPLLFMGEEFAASSPFLFFCDFGPELAPKVVQGRREEFAAFERFRTPQAQARIPDPGTEQTFTASKLDWSEVVKTRHAEWHTLFSDLLELRRRRLVPHLAGSRHAAEFAVDGAGLSVDWTLGNGSRLHLRANFSEAAWANVPDAPGELLFAAPGAAAAAALPAWSALWTLEPIRA